MGEADKRFAKMMIKHHQAALVMSRAYLKVGSDPVLMAMATTIIEAQSEEIGRLQQRLREAAR